MPSHLRCWKYCTVRRSILSHVCSRTLDRMAGSASANATTCSYFVPGISSGRLSLALISDIDDGDDTISPVNNDNLVADDEVEIPTVPGIIFDEDPIDGYDTNRARNHNANIDREVDIARTRPLCQDRLANPGTLFGRQRDGPGATAIPGLAPWGLAALAIAIALDLLTFTTAVLGLSLFLLRLNLSLLRLSLFLLGLPLPFLRLTLLALPARPTLLIAGSLAWGPLLALFFPAGLLAF